MLCIIYILFTTGRVLYFTDTCSYLLTPQSFFSFTTRAINRRVARDERNYCTRIQGIYDFTARNKSFTLFFHFPYFLFSHVSEFLLFFFPFINRNKPQQNFFFLTKFFIFFFTKLSKKKSKQIKSLLSSPLLGHYVFFNRSL